MQHTLAAIDLFCNRRQGSMKHGVYFLAGTSDLTLRLAVPAAGRVRTVTPIPPRIAQGPRGLAVSSDGRTIVYAQDDLTMDDILFLEKIP